MISLQNHLMKTYSENHLASMLSLKLSSSSNSNTKLHAQCHNGLLITKFKSFLSLIVLAFSTNINTVMLPSENFLPLGLRNLSHH